MGTKPRKLEPAGPNPAEMGYDEAMEAVSDALRRIEYGSILITIHQGEVVGIETSTKLRIKRPQ